MLFSKTMVKRFGAVQTERWVWTHFAHLSGQSPGDRSTDSPKWIINKQYANPHKWSFDCDFPTSYIGQIRGNGITFVSYMYMQKDYREQCYYPVMFQRSIVTGCVLICQGKLPSDCPLEGSRLSDQAKTWPSQRHANPSGMDMSPIHQVWPKPSCKAQWTREEDEKDRKRAGRTY